MSQSSEQVTLQIRMRRGWLLRPMVWLCSALGWLSPNADVDVVGNRIARLAKLEYRQGMRGRWQPLDVDWLP